MAVSQSLTLTQSSQSVSGNTSKVRILWKTTQNDGSFNNYERTAYYYVSINGGPETRYSVKYTLPAGSTKTLVDKTITVEHKADGKGSIKVRTWMDTDISAGVIEKSQSLTLDTIPRATTPDLSKTSPDMGSNVTIDLPRASSSFTHDLAYKVDGESTWHTIKTGATTTYTWTTPDLATKVPNATSLGITLRVITKSGSTTIGTKTASMTLKVPDSVVPDAWATVKEAVSGLAAQFGAFVQGKSQIAFEIEAEGVKGSTIKEYQAIFAGKVYNTAEWTSPVLASAGRLAVQYKVKDSRGRWSTTKGVNFDVLAYTKPEINAFEAYRCKSNGTEDPSGEYVAIKYKYNVKPLDNRNTASMTVSYKTADASGYTPLLTNTALSADTTVVPSRLFPNSQLFDLKMELTDWFNEEPYTVAYAVIPTEEVILDIKADGLGVAFGGVSSRTRAFESFWPIVPSAGILYEELPNGENLNNLRESNVYKLGASNGYLNSPPDDAGGGVLEVFAWSDVVFQRFTSARKNRSKVYLRFYASGSWGAWYTANSWLDGLVYFVTGVTSGSLRVRYNPDLGLVDIRGSVTYKTTEAVSAGAELTVAKLPDELVPDLTTPLSVYRAATGTGWVKAVISTDGNIKLRPGSSLSANASATYYLSGMYQMDF